MIAYTGIETVSNLAEEARDPPRDVPRVDPARRGRRLRDLLHAPGDRPLGAARDGRWAASTRPCSGCRRRRAATRTTRCSGVVDNLGVTASLLDALQIYVGLLAATILFIATNAGVIGASRITYAMSGYRQLPEVFRRLHPRFKTPWISLVVFAGFVSIAVILPGPADFLGTMYSFGAMLSFTIAHVSVIALRVRQPDDELVFRARPNLRVPRRRLAALRDRRRPRDRLAWLVVVVQQPTHALGRARLARDRLRRLRRLPAPVRACSAHARRCARRRSSSSRARDRLPDDRRAGAADRRVGGGARRRGAARRRARRDDRARARASRCRSTCRSTPTCRSEEARPARVSTRPRRSLEGYGVRTVEPSRARAQRRAGDRRGRVGRDAELIVVGAPRTRCAAASRSSAGPSTTS